MRVSDKHYFSYSSKTDGVSFIMPTKKQICLPCCRSNISFRGEPWRLNLYELGIPVSTELSAAQAIKVYNEFKVGNYLDIGDDRHSYFHNANIRKQNLSFLDRVTNPSEKKKFINYYKELTGFPNLAVVSEKIKNEFVRAVAKSSNELNNYHCTNRFDILEAGYDGVCSVGRNKALPGSDLDKAYIIIRGSGNKYGDKNDVNDFKGKLWFNTDQRILSYNHDEAAFPQVYTIQQIEKLVEAADRKYNNENYLKYLSLKDTYHDDYLKANPFFIELGHKFPMHSSDDIDIDNPSKENIKNVGFVLEALREGVYFSSLGKLDYSKLSKSSTYNLTNLSQLSALKNRNDCKPKRLARENLKSDFDSWGIDKQYRFVKTLIESGCSNNTDFTEEFRSYFSRAGKDPFEPLLKSIMEH